MDFTAMFIGLLIGVIAGGVIAVWFMLRWARREAAQRSPEIDTNALAGAVHSVAFQALQENQHQFLALAEQRLARATEANRNELTAKTVAFESLIDPLNDSLDHVHKTLRETEKLQAEAHVALREQLKSVSETSLQLRQETRQLVNALRAPHQRGTWGEMQLRRVVEAAGMLAHCDFTEQFQVKNAAVRGVDVALASGTSRLEAQSLRPDMVVHLPGERHLVLDAKTPLLGFLDAYDATDEPSRKAALSRHVAHVRKHIEQLSSKQYWESVTGTPEFVIMFLPSDNFVSVAYEADPMLFEFAMERQVVIATPSTLIALLRTVGFAWRSDAMTNNATEVLQAGRDLHARFASFAKHYGDLGKRLESGVKAYNTALGTLESRVLPAARRFNDLQVTETELEVGEPLDAQVRQFRSPELSA